TDDLMKSSGSGDAGNSTHADEQRLYPKVRFRGFDEPWKNKKFLTFSSKITKNSTSDDIDFPRIEFENIVSGEGKLAQNRSKLNHIKSGIKFDKGDILFGKLRPYLKNWWLAEFPGVAVGDFWVIRAKDNRYFLYYLIQAPLFEKVSNYTTGTKMPRSDWNYVSNTFFKLPKIDEQEKIGRILDKVDSLLSLQQRKLELEKQIFYALKTHIFAKDLFFNGQKDMIKYKLKDVSNMYQPETITATQMSTNGYKVFGANGYIGHYYNFNHKDDAITICARGASTGAVNFVPGPVWITGNSMVVDIDSKLINQLYFYYYLTTLNLKKYITGGAQPQLTKEILNGINVNLIPINIQIKVANILVLKLSNFLCK
ncbi:restriction endonuclease subunit S, partial [Lactobacillus jensenii]